MRVLNKKDKPFPIVIECEKCGTIFEIESTQDIENGIYGIAYVTCPVCGKKTDSCNVDDLKKFDKEITAENIEFPTDFSDNKDGVETSPNEIKEEIRKAISFFRRYPDEFAHYTCGGDTAVCVYNVSTDNNYYVVVAKGYFDTYIPYQKEDYVARDGLEMNNKN